jgi:eukaryotic-like serine/threonine-protein kinase
MHAILDSGTLLGRYELVMPIAQGGMSEVWLARAKGVRGFQQLFALKALLPAHAANPELVTMFLDEARIASKIRHSNVVGIVDLGEQDGALFLAMEWVEGETVAALLRRGPVPLRVATRIVLDTCRAAHAAHELRDEDGRPYGLVHRDISPQNILLSPAGAVKLTDFGVLKASFGREIAETLPGRVKGKAAYMAPEQIADSSTLDRRGDVFALGVVLYRLALGEHPFRGRTDIETMTRIVRAVLPAVLAGGCDRGLEAVLRKALSKRPEDRFATAADMAEAIEALDPVAAPASPDEIIDYVQKTAGAQVRARRKLVLRTLQELDTASVDPRPSSGASSVSALVMSANLPAAAALDAASIASRATEKTPAPVIEIDLAPPSVADLGRSKARRPRWRERAKGAAAGAVVLVLAHLMLGLGSRPAPAPGVERGTSAVALAPSSRPLAPRLEPPVLPANAASSKDLLAAEPEASAAPSSARHAALRPKDPLAKPSAVRTPGALTHGHSTKSRFESEDMALRER